MYTYKKAEKIFLRSIVPVALLLGMTTVALPSAEALAYPADQSVVVATAVCPTNSSGGNGCNLPEVDTSNDSGSVLKIALQILFGVIGAFALLSVTLSGFKYITSAGNPQRTSEAKAGVAYALVGLMLAISAEAIVAFVVNRGSP